MIYLIKQIDFDNLDEEEYTSILGYVETPEEAEEYIQKISLTLKKYNSYMGATYPKLEAVRVEKINWLPDDELPF